jgi:hypothetical protein
MSTPSRTSTPMTPYMKATNRPTEAQLQAAFLAARELGIILQDDVLIAIITAYQTN